MAYVFTFLLGSCNHFVLLARSDHYGQRQSPPESSRSYEEALKEAAGDRGFKAWHKIWRAINAAYLVRYGGEFIPKPRVHYLHRELLKMVDSEPLSGLTLEGLLEFLDYMCPCGKKHKRDAVRKLRARFAIQKKKR